MQGVHGAEIEGRGAGRGKGGCNLFADGAGFPDPGQGDPALQLEELPDEQAEVFVKLGRLLEYGIALLLEDSPSFFDNVVGIGAHGTEG